MKAYLLNEKGAKVEKPLEKSLQMLDLEIEKHEVPTDHEDILDIFGEKEGGLIFIPALWQDLYCVKLVQEIERLRGGFQSVIFGKKPDIAELITAFNNGLGAFLEMPPDTQNLKQIVARMTARMQEKAENDLRSMRLGMYESGVTPKVQSKTNPERDRLLARALVDFLKQRGPVVSGEASVLLVTASGAQQHALQTFLKEIGLHVDTAPDIKKGIEYVMKNDYRLIVSDNILPDGDAAEMAASLRRTIKKALPRLIVWSSSPEKFAELLSPEKHIDDVMLKPGPGAGMESVIPSVIAAIYSSES